MKMSWPTPWIMTHDGSDGFLGFTCDRCKDHRRMREKMDVTDWLRASREYIAIHKDCIERLPIVVDPGMKPGTVELRGAHGSAFAINVAADRPATPERPGCRIGPFTATPGEHYYIKQQADDYMDWLLSTREAFAREACEQLLSEIKDWRAWPGHRVSIDRAIAHAKTTMGDQ